MASLTITKFSEAGVETPSIATSALRDDVIKVIRGTCSACGERSKCGKMTYVSDDLRIRTTGSEIAMIVGSNRCLLVNKEIHY